jgi:hypothetical protein
MSFSSYLNSPKPYLELYNELNAFNGSVTNPLYTAQALDGSGGVDLSTIIDIISLADTTTKTIIAPAGSYILNMKAQLVPLADAAFLSTAQLYLVDTVNDITIATSPAITYNTLGTIGSKNCFNHSQKLVLTEPTTLTMRLYYSNMSPEDFAVYYGLVEDVPEEYTAHFTLEGI